MNDVIWILLDDDDRIIEQVLLPETHEEQAIDEFAVRLKLRHIRGRYRVGYIRADHSKHINSGYQIF